MTLIFLGWVYARCHRPDQARLVVREYEALGKRRSIDPIGLAVLLGALGEIDTAIALVERSLREHSPSAIALDGDPMLDPLRGDPRFKEMADRVRGR